jgi:hypothetical protein
MVDHMRIPLHPFTHQTTTIRHLVHCIDQALEETRTTGDERHTYIIA